MSDRKFEASRQVQLPARVRTDVYEGVPPEMGDRRAISTFAMFALDEPEDSDRPKTAKGDETLVAFLPLFCRG